MSAQMAAQEAAQPAAQRATKRGELGEEIIKHKFKSAIFQGW
jgi:hypothetical protein